MSWQREHSMQKGRIVRPEKDAYGQELWACHNGRETFEIVERDDGYVDAMDTKVYFFDYKNWSLFEQEAMRFGKGRVLDVGCGAGRHSLYLQEKGFDVLGIDISPLAVRVCKLRGLRRVQIMSIENIDFPMSSFDTIMIMGNNFGLFGNFKKARRLLKRFHAVTSQNALIIANTRDPYKTDNPAHREYHKTNKKKGRMGGQVRIRIRFEKCATEWFDYLIVSKDEMKEILKGTGWKVREFIDTDSPNYVAVIDKM